MICSSQKQSGRSDRSGLEGAGQGQVVVCRRKTAPTGSRVSESYLPSGSSRQRVWPQLFFRFGRYLHLFLAHAPRFTLAHHLHRLHWLHLTRLLPRYFPLALVPASRWIIVAIIIHF